MTPAQRKNMRAIVRAVAQSHGLTEADIYVRDRSKNISYARAVAWRECHLAGHSYTTIAELAGWNFQSVAYGIGRAIP